MSQIDPYSQKAYWEDAGKHGYGNHMFGSVDVEQHIRRRLWEIAVDFGHQLGLTSEVSVLDLGCGDGAFANQMLASHFAKVKGVDFVESGVSRANAESPREDVSFEVCDLVKTDVRTMPRYDGAFLIGILHHLKSSTPSIIAGLREITPRVVVLEPNGDNLVRKLLELTPSYRAAGEDSFRTNELPAQFERAGFRAVLWRRLNVFPNFTPRFAFRLLHPLEPRIEASPLLRSLCTVNMYAFQAE